MMNFVSWDDYSIPFSEWKVIIQPCSKPPTLCHDIFPYIYYLFLAIFRCVLVDFQAIHGWAWRTFMLICRARAPRILAPRRNGNADSDAC